MTQHSRRWTLAVDTVQTDTWYFLELSWDVHRGFQLFINRDLRDELAYSESETASTTRQTKGRFMIGFADDSDVDVPTEYGDFIVDEIELWFQDRSTLLAFGYIDRGQLFPLYNKYFSRPRNQLVRSKSKRRT